MTASIARISLESTEKMFTIEDLAALPIEVPSGPVDYELDNGRLLTMVPPGDLHGAIQARIVAQLVVQGEHRGQGVARSEVGIVLRRNPDRLVGADAAFIARDSLPIRRSPEGYLETMPDLVVEVRSRNDPLAYVQRKVEDYLAAGVRSVLVIDPEPQSATVHSRANPPRVFGKLDTLRLDDVIPGFCLPVVDLFPE
jgi:Uma2 family endonuclease